MIRSLHLSLVVSYQYVNLVSSCIGMLHSCSFFQIFTAALQGETQTEDAPLDQKKDVFRPRSDLIHSGTRDGTLTRWS